MNFESRKLLSNFVRSIHCSWQARLNSKRELESNKAKLSHVAAAPTLTRHFRPQFLTTPFIRSIHKCGDVEIKA